MGFHLFRPSDDFFTDRLVRRYSVVVFLVVAITLAISLSSPNAVTCHMPAQFTDSHIKYGNAACWNQGFFSYINNDKINDYVYYENYEQLYKKNGYDLRKMRFLPIILAFQTFIFLLPRVLWKTLTTLIGFSTDRIVTTAGMISKENSTNELKGIQCLGAHTLSLLQRPFPLLQRPFPLLGNTVSSVSGYLLLPSYLLCKLGYSVVCIMQFSIIGAFLNINAFSYGFGRIPWKSYVQFHTHTQGNETILEAQYMFPRIGRCDYEIIHQGRVHSYAVQCDIHSSEMIECMLYIIWAWLWICICLLSLSIFAWILRFIAHILSPKDYQLNRIGILLGISPLTETCTTLPTIDEKEMTGFVKNFLKPDGYFLLEMIEDNVSLGSAAQVVTAAWESYRLQYGQSETVTEQKPSTSFQQWPTPHKVASSPGAYEQGPTRYSIIKDDPGTPDATAPRENHSDNEKTETLL